jgi:FMN phosphatase YigB (HAD superfamily)
MTLNVQAYLFDLGHVIVDIHLENFLPRLGIDGTMSVDEAIVTYERSGISREFELGRISFDQFYERSCRLFSLDVERSRFLAAWNAIIGDEKPGMYELIHTCAEHAPVYLLSNTNEPHFGEALRKSPVLGLMKRFYLSYEMHLMKPDPRIYRETVERIGLPAGAIFFTDDRADNIASAEEAGLQVHRFENPERLGEILLR